MTRLRKMCTLREVVKVSFKIVETIEILERTPMTLDSLHTWLSDDPMKVTPLGAGM